jgi:hypothetical protein
MKLLYDNYTTSPCSIVGATQSHADKTLVHQNSPSNTEGGYLPIKNNLTKVQNLRKVSRMVKWQLLLLGLLMGQVAWAQSPGGVSSSLQLWFDPATGVTTGAGNTVTTWNNRGTATTADFTAGTASLPTLVSANLKGNFHPYINVAAGQRMWTPAVLTTANIPQTAFLAASGLTKTHGTYIAAMIYRNDVTTSGTHNFGLGKGDTQSDVNLHYITGGGTDNRFNSNMAIDATRIYLYGARVRAGGGAGAKSVSVNGNNADYADNVTNNLSASDRFLFGDDTYGNTGDISEIIVYNRDLSDAERIRVNTYLGMKYGMTLDHNYVAGNGTTVYWDKTANATYHNNVFGIGKDDAGYIDQKQGKATRPETFSPIFSTTTLAATNAANTTSLTDQTFEMAGSNTGAASFATAITAPLGMTANFRMTRIWKIQETGAVGTIKFAVPQTGTGSTVYLIRSTDATFDATDNWIPLSNTTVNGDTYQVGDIDFNNGDFFTIATFVTAPGAVTSGLMLWYNPAVSASVDGSNRLTNWKNIGSLSGADLSNGTATTPRLQAATAAQNYYPYIGVAASERMWTDAVLPSGIPQTSFLAGRLVPAGGPSSMIWRNDDGTSVTHNHGLGVDASGDANLHYIAGGAVANRTNTSIIPVSTKPYIFGGRVIAGGGAGAKSVSVNGSNTDYADNVTNTLVNDDVFVFGDHTYGSTGDVQEIIQYNTNISDQDRQKVNTYLAVKYGITLTHDYVSSANTTIWNRTTNTGYNNNIFGLLREINSGIDQKISRSINDASMLVIGTNDMSLPLSNLNASRTSLSDAQSFIAGDNNAAASAYTATTTCGGDAISVLTRKWKVQNTGNVGALYFTVNFTASGINQSVKMIIESTGGVKREVEGVMKADGTATFAAKVANGETFTFGGVRGTGICATCTGFSVLEWRYSNWPTSSTTNTSVTLPLTGATDLTASAIFNDPENIESNKLRRPNRRGKTLQLDRRDNISPTSTANGGAYTGVFTLNKATLARFKIHAIDKWGKDCRDIVEVKGYCGATLITPKLSYVMKASQSSYTISGNVATGGNKWSGYFDKRGMVNVDFDRAVDKIEIIWKASKTGTAKRFQRIGISDMTFECPAPEPCLANDDNVTFTKRLQGNITSLKTCENAVFEYTVKNQNCAAQTVNIADVLPAGMAWIADSYEEGDIVGTPNAYGGTDNFTLSNITIAAGKTIRFTVSAKFTNLTANTYANRATLTVAGGVAGTIQSGCGNTTWSTTVSTPPSVPTISQTINKTCYNQNEVATVTVTFNNTSGAAITNAEFSTALQDNFRMVAGSISNVFGGTVEIPDGETGYGDLEYLDITGMTIPTGTSTFTYQLNSNLSDETVPFVAYVSADPNADCAEESEQSSTVVNIAKCACTAGATAPTLSGTTLTNTCPTTTVNLNSLHTGTEPNGSRLRWHTVATNPTTADSVATPSVLATAGTYYAYYFDATNACYSPATAAVTVTITTCCTNPVITMQPVNTTLCTPGTVTASLAATGTGLTYQWESKPVGSTWGNAGEGGNATATITLETGSHPEYRCKISSGSCFVYSDVITLTKIAKPVITTQPVAPTTCGAMTVAATGTGLTYQWEWSADGTNSAGNAGETGNTTATIQLGANSGVYYRCKVTSSNGCFVYTNWVLFTRGAAPTLSATTASNTCPAATANLNSLVTSTAPSGTTLVWFTNNAATGSAYATPSAATAGTYYAFYHKTADSCHTSVSSAVTVTTTSCCTVNTITPIFIKN